jgi:SIR2-like domain
MMPELIARAEDEFERGAFERFIKRNDPLDVAQLFRLTVGEEKYFEFLDSQFETRREDADLLTPSHQALVELPISEVFTTNYDGLIELAFERFDHELVVSPDRESFLRNKVQNPDHHLVKLHGTWDDHPSIVLTRDDYARSRMARAEMFDSFAQEARFTTFLFIGFSLSDPNFNLIRDEARAVMGEAMPTSYLVQEHTDPVTQRYLESLDVETISLFSWNELPRFLRAINPRNDTASAG